MNEIIIIVAVFIIKIIVNYCLLQEAILVMHLISEFYWKFLGDFLDVSFQLN